MPISPRLEKESLDFLRLLVETHSGPENISGINRVQDLLQARLGALGFTCERIANPTPGIASAELLVATFEGEDTRKIDFVSHADTLQSGVEDKATFFVDEASDIAIGPGVMDDKGGQIVALNGISAYLRSLGGTKPPFSLRFISSPSEEFGSPGFQSFFQKLSQDSLLTLGFEPSLDDGAIIESRRGNRWYKIKVEGREAHSGRAHRHGINAAHDLALKIGEIQKLTDYSRDVTVNVGQIRAGKDAFNIVCGEAEAKLDTRFSTLEDRDELHLKIHEVISQSHIQSFDDGTPSRATYEIADDCPPFSANPGTQVFISEYLRIVEEIEGRKITSRMSGGAADCCYMSRPGLRIIDGLGPSGGKMHTIEEHVSLKSLDTRARALDRLLQFALPLLRSEAPKK